MLFYKAPFMPAQLAQLKIISRSNREGGGGKKLRISELEFAQFSLWYIFVYISVDILVDTVTYDSGTRVQLLSDNFQKSNLKALI